MKGPPHFTKGFPSPKFNRVLAEFAENSHLETAEVVSALAFPAEVCFGCRDALGGCISSCQSADKRSPHYTAGFPSLKLKRAIALFAESSQFSCSCVGISMKSPHLSTDIPEEL